jgi:hypothetical protein
MQCRCGWSNGGDYALMLSNKAKLVEFLPLASSHSSSSMYGSLPHYTEPSAPNSGFLFSKGMCCYRANEAAPPCHRPGEADAVAYCRQVLRCTHVLC